MVSGLSIFIGKILVLASYVIGPYIYILSGVDEKFFVEHH